MFPEPTQTLFGIRVIFSDNAVQVKYTRNKVHKHRRNQSLAYHRRVDKKWSKRYGSTKVETPCAYRLGPTDVTSEAFVMHPTFRPVVEHYVKSSGRLQADMSDAYYSRFLPPGRFALR